jgi:DNA-binding transcriptional MocR family regulator
MTQHPITGRGAKQIAASVERGIETGALAPGDPLPPVRQLAQRLGVSPTTVAAAFAELRARGLVLAHARSRTTVSWRPPVLGAAPPLAVPAGVRDLASGNPDPALLPALAPLLRRLEPPNALYGCEQALPELLELAAAELHAEGIDAEQLAVVSGALDGVERVVQARLRPGDVVAVEDPGFAGLYDVLRAHGLALAPVALDARGMLPDALEAALAGGAAAVVVNVRGQNPTGASLDPARAAQLRRVLVRFPDVLVLEDDHLGPIAGAPRVTLTAGRTAWAAARSLAKSLGPDLRVAVLAGDAHTISRVRGRQAVGPGWVSHLLQQLAVTLWRDPDVAAALAETTATYRERRGRFTAALQARGIAHAGGSGLNVWIPVPEETRVVQALRERGWAVAPGARFRLRSERAIRVTTSTLAAEEAERLADALAELLAAAPGGGTARAA